MKIKIAAALVITVLILAPVLAKDLFLQVREEALQGNQTSAVPQPPAPADANYSLKTFSINYLNAQEIKDSITNILAQGEGVSVNASTNSVIVRASGKNLDRIEKVIKSIDKMPSQVHVEAKIIEVTTGNGDSNNPSTFGFSWQYIRTPGSSNTPPGSNNFAQFIGQQPPTGDAAAPGLYAQVLKDNVNAYFTALEKKGNYDIVASPSITAINHMPSEIFIGGKIGYRNFLNSTTGTLSEIQYLESGTKLVFTPNITDDGYIKMAINPSVSEGTLTSDDLPVQTLTEAKNFVIVKDGETIVIGGLTKNYKTKTEIGVPYISSIPIIGNFFKRTELIQQKRDILVLITPHILTDDYNRNALSKAQQMEDDQKKKIDDTNMIN